MSLRGYCRTESERIDCKPGDQDHQVDDDREDGSLDEQVGELHQLSSGAGAGSLAGWICVVDDDGGAVAELEHARGHDLVARVDARRRPRPGRRAPRRASRTAGARRDRSGPSGRTELGDDEDRIAVGRIADRRPRQRDGRAAARRGSPPPARTCPGAARRRDWRRSPAPGRSACRSVDHRIDRGDAALEPRHPRVSGW